MNLTPISGLRDRSLLRRCLSHLLLYTLTLVASNAQAGAAVAADSVRNVLVEVYFRSDDSEHPAVVTFLEELKKTRGGITIVLRDTEREPKDQQRLDAILRHYKVAPGTSPVIYGCNRAIYDFSRTNVWESQLCDMLRMEVFVRTGCPHCAAAKRWLPQFMEEYPGLELVYHDIAVDSASAARLSRIVAEHQTMAASVPVFYVADKILVGFENEASTGDRLRMMLKSWTHVDPTKEVSKQPQNRKPSGDRRTSMMLKDSGSNLSSFLAVQTSVAVAFQLLAGIVAEGRISAADEDPGLPMPTDDRPTDETTTRTDDELPMPGSESESGA